VAARDVAIETVQLTKTFHDFWHRAKARALDNVDLEMYRGEVFGLLGPNGSGKSTMIKIILGLLFPTSGSVAIFGHHPRNIRVKERIGYLPEESYLYRYLNATETLDFYGRLFNLPAHERRRRTDALLEMVGLHSQRRRPLSEYSKGMSRRIGLAQALINDPELLLLDEPTTGLDPLGTRQIKELVRKLKARGKTVLLCSHLLADVEDVCDRIGILYGGRLWAVGPVEELLAKQELTQIVAPALDEETLARVKSVILERQKDAEVRVEHPIDRLESYFLRVVDEARAARVDMSDVTAGAGLAEFLHGAPGEPAEKTGEEVLAELATGAVGPLPSDEQPEQVPLPATPVAEEVDERVLGELTPAAAEPMQQEPPMVEPASASPDEEEPRETEEVLERLLDSHDPGQPQPEPAGADNAAGSGDETESPGRSEAE